MRRRNKIHNKRKRSLKKSRSVSKRSISSSSDTMKLSRTRKCRNKTIFKWKKRKRCNCRRCVKKEDDKIGRRFYSGIMASVLAMAIFV
jgi:hypothetical protein